MPAKTKKAPKKPAPTSVDVTVFVPCGKVRAGEIMRAAVIGARDQIPMAAIGVNPRVVSASDVRKDKKGVEGRDYLVSISWTPRPTRSSFTPEDEDEDGPTGTVDEVIVALEPLTPQRIADTIDAAQAQEA
jgi:hypothetical protein